MTPLWVLNRALSNRFLRPFQWTYVWSTKRPYDPRVPHSWARAGRGETFRWIPDRLWKVKRSLLMSDEMRKRLVHAFYAFCIYILCHN